MKTLTPTNLIAVEVPKDATYIQVWIHGIGFKTKLINRKSDDSNGFYHLETGLFRWKDFEILGEVTDTEISFECHDLVNQKYKLSSCTGNIGTSATKFFDYTKKDHSLSFSDESFRSLLQSNGLYFEHCCGNLIDDGVVGETCCHKPNGIKGKLIILKQK